MNRGNNSMHTTDKEEVVKCQSYKHVMEQKNKKRLLHPHPKLSLGLVPYKPFTVE